jgi:hypothetical protein
MPHYSRPVFALVLGSLLSTSLVAGAVQAAENPFAAARAPTLPQEQMQLEERAREQADAVRKCGYKAPAEKCQAGKAVRELPRAAPGAIERDKLKSGFCGAGKCGGGKCGESLRQPAAR